MQNGKSCVQGRIDNMAGVRLEESGCVDTPVGGNMEPGGDKHAGAYSGIRRA